MFRAKPPHVCLGHASPTHMQHIKRGVWWYGCGLHVGASCAILVPPFSNPDISHAVSPSYVLVRGFLKDLCLHGADTSPANRTNLHPTARLCQRPNTIP